MNSYGQMSILLINTKVVAFQACKDNGTNRLQPSNPVIFSGQRLHCKSIKYRRKTKTCELNKRCAVIDFEFPIYMPWQTFFESLVTLTLNMDSQRRYTTLWRAGTIVKVTMIFFKTIPELFPVLS